MKLGKAGRLYKQQIHPRMIIARFCGNPTTTVISCNSPSKEEAVAKFYQQPSSLTHRIPKHNVVLIGGDMNAQIGNEITFHSWFICKSKTENISYQQQVKITTLPNHQTKPLGSNVVPTQKDVTIRTAKSMEHS